MDLIEMDRRQCFITNDRFVELRNTFNRILIDLEIDQETADKVRESIDKAKFDLDECLENVKGPP